jgi:hypothetical protein
VHWFCHKNTVKGRVVNTSRSFERATKFTCLGTTAGSQNQIHEAINSR